MGDDINVKQMKEFIEFRLDKVEAKVDKLPDVIESLHKEHTDNDAIQALAIQTIGDKVNLIFKIVSYVGTVLVGIATTIWLAGVGG